MLPSPGLRPPIESDGLKKPSRFTLSGIPENKLLAYFHIVTNTSPRPRFLTGGFQALHEKRPAMPA